MNLTTGDIVSRNRDSSFGTEFDIDSLSEIGLAIDGYHVHKRSTGIDQHVLSQIKFHEVSHRNGAVLDSHAEVVETIHRHIYVSEGSHIIDSVCCGEGSDCCRHPNRFDCGVVFQSHSSFIDLIFIGNCEVDHEVVSIEVAVGFGSEGVNCDSDVVIDSYENLICNHRIDVTSGSTNTNVVFAAGQFGEIVEHVDHGVVDEVYEVHGCPFGFVSSTNHEFHTRNGRIVHSNLYGDVVSMQARSDNAD